MNEMNDFQRKYCQKWLKKRETTYRKQMGIMQEIKPRTFPMRILSGFQGTDISGAIKLLQNTEKEGNLPIILRCYYLLIPK